jgi:anti-sigma factor RsiW
MSTPRSTGFQDPRDSSDRSDLDAPPFSLCSAEGPTLLDLAAYIDGAATESQRQSIQAHLAACAACREAVHDAQEARLQGSGSLTFVPQHVLDAAMNLVPSPQHEPVSARHRRIWPAASIRFAAAAAAVAVCVVGHAVGGMLTMSQDPSESLDAAASFGLVDSDSSDAEPTETELLALALAEAGT